MNQAHFRILYREFLFRLMDVEVLSQSARGDSNELLGQFGALLVFASLIFSLVGMVAGAGHLRPEQLMSAKWSAFHIMVSTTMLTVGLFAVLSWDSTFLDRRDVMVLAPLPVRGRTMFLAKVSAVAVALAITIGALNWASGVLVPLALASDVGFFGLLRLFAVYWIVLIAAGAFVYCALLGLQGIIAQLPRRWFLRISSWLQMGSFGLLIAVYFMQPSIFAPRALAAASNQRTLDWLPTYWFLGLFSEWSGAFSSGHSVMSPLANRAMAGFAIALVIAGVAFLLSYFRTLRKIVEEPDILPVTRGAVWLPAFGNLRMTALVQFAVRSLLRSRQHRMIVAFYLGFGFAVVALGAKSAMAEERIHPGSVSALLNADMTMLFSSVLMLVAWILGTRFGFAIPLDLRANWVFRLTPVPAGPGIQLAARRSLLVLSVAPLWIGAAAMFFWKWPWPRAAAHLAALILLGSILDDICLYGFRKIPFTCSYLPGKSRVHITFWLCSMLILQIIVFAVDRERRALYSLPATIAMLILLAVAVIVARLIVQFRAREDVDIQWEEFRSDEVVLLNLTSG